MMSHHLKFLLFFLKRVFNYFVIQLQYRLSSQYLWGHPYVLIIDTINICNLKCQLCPTGLDMPGRNKGRMELSLFRKIIDDLGDYAFTVVLQNWGEPLLNKDIYPMISYVKQKYIKAILSSNLNILREKDAEALVASGLDELIVSLDGVSAETYEKYRKGGNYQQVIKNIELLVKKKEEMRSNKPKIIWQFLVFRHNVHEVSKVKMMGRQLRVDDIDIFSAQLGGPGQTPYLGDKSTAEFALKWLVPDKRFRGQFDYFSNPNYLSKNRCYFLWKTVTINWDGSVSPCCCVYEPSTDFGNVKEERIDQIWNNDLYKNSRGLFSKNNKRIPRDHTICAACKVFKKLE